MKKKNIILSVILLGVILLVLFGSDQDDDSIIIRNNYQDQNGEKIVFFDKYKFEAICSCIGKCFEVLKKPEFKISLEEPRIIKKIDKTEVVMMDLIGNEYISLFTQIETIEDIYITKLVINGDSEMCLALINPKFYERFKKK